MTARPPAPPATASPDEVDRLLHWMPVIVGAATLLPWDRTFCASMVRQARGGRFQPSARQIRQMQRIVRAYCRAMLGAEPDHPAPRDQVAFGSMGSMARVGRDDGGEQGCGGKS